MDEQLQKYSLDLDGPVWMTRVLLELETLLMDEAQPSYSITGDFYLPLDERRDVTIHIHPSNETFGSTSSVETLRRTQKAYEKRNITAEEMGVKEPVLFSLDFHVSGFVWGTSQKRAKVFDEYGSDILVYAPTLTQEIVDVVSENLSEYVVKSEE